MTTYDVVDFVKRITGANEEKRLDEIVTEVIMSSTIRKNFHVQEEVKAGLRARSKNSNSHKSFARSDVSIFNFRTGLLNIKTCDIATHPYPWLLL